MKLPLLAQKLVLNQMDLVSVIELSMVSKKFKRVLQLSKITIEKFVYAFKTDSLSLIIYTPSTGCYIITPSFTSSVTTNIWNISGSELIIINGATSFSPYRRVLVKNKKGTDESKLKSLEKITGHLLKFLKVKNFKLDIKTNLDILNLFIWKCTKRFDTIDLHHQNIDSVVVTPDEIELLLETLTIDDLFLKVQTKDDFNFKYLSPNQRLSKICKITIIRSNWLEHVSLLNMARESIYCQIPTGINGKANEILKKWILGENETLEELELFASGFQEKCNQEEVLMSINAIPSIFKLEEIEKRCYVPDLSIIKDIRRDHDGCQATVVINDFKIQLLVWNKKHLRAIGRM